VQNLLNRLKLVLATFRVVTTFRSETNNHRTNIRFDAGTEEAESLNEKYSFQINLLRRRPPCGKITDCRELRTLKALAR